MTITKKKIFEQIKKYLLIVVGSAVVAFGIDAFLLPNKLTAGGISGLSTVIYYALTHLLPIGTLVLIINIPLFILGLIFCGRSFVFGTIFSTVCLSGFLNLFGQISPLTQDPMLAALFGGFICGVGIAAVFYAGTSTGGTDIIAKLFQRIFRSMSIGSLLLAIDAFIIVLAMVVLKDMQIGLYSVVAIFVQTRIIDVVLEGANFAKMCFIISDKSEEISKDIMKIRGVTGLRGVGMYTGADKIVLLCTAKSRQIPLVKDIVKGHDKEAFLIVSDVREVMGEFD